MGGFENLEKWRESYWLTEEPTGRDSFSLDIFIRHLYDATFRIGHKTFGSFYEIQAL